MKISYTYTDEAPALATQSLLPIIEAFCGAAGIELERRDISLAGRIIAAFPDRVTGDQRVPDALAELGELAARPEANIIKLPNISASIPQVKAAIRELQDRGYDVPDYPEDVETDEDREVRARYNAVKGSAVNPVLRQGNSDRRAPRAVKEYARRNPHSMGEWTSDSKTHVASMDAGDFRSSEQSTTVADTTHVRVELVGEDDGVTVLKERLSLLPGEVIDAAVMSRRQLVDFLRREMEDAKQQGVLFSLHLKATMMKVSDPIMFGHAVHTYFAQLFAEHEAVLDELGVDHDDGLAAIVAALNELPAERRAAIEASLSKAYDDGPALAMVDSDRGITNLHVPSDVIIDASMPAMIRTSGKMWNAAAEQQDAKAVIPDSSYSALYDETIKFHQEYGAFDPTTMGTVPNVGLMAQAAEEYGSHDKTFEIPDAGTVRIVDGNGETLSEHAVEKGDIWRMCQTKDAPVRDWVKLAVTRARATGWPAVFWLDETRPHDAQLIAKVQRYLGHHDTEGLDIQIMDVATATRHTLERAKNGENTISVTGNVLRDYLTDLFPILELGTSAKMLSIVPLMSGGGLFETGAGGSAPRHVQQFLKENHLRWDSLGEFMALAASLEHLANVTENPRAQILAEALETATERVLLEGRSPSRKVTELDTRGSHFYLALYWAEALAQQTADNDLATASQEFATALADAEEKIVGELNAVQGTPIEIGGYYLPDHDRAAEAMRPSATFNQLLEAFG